MEILYDKSQKRLLFFKKMEDTFWDQLWAKEDIEAIYQNLSRFNIVNRITKRYLNPEDGPILEGGCGLGQYVYSLNEAGYECYGIDVAEKTVAKIKETYPHLKIDVMDVRKLDYPDNYFAGYWSLGVIEHFFEGYDTIVREMYRVLKENGYLFITVPVMSLLRKFKAKSGFYPDWQEHEHTIKDFYQFAFNPKNVIKSFENKGFTLIDIKPYDGVKGLKDEVPAFKPFLQSLYNRKDLPSKSIKKIISIMIRYFTNHMCLFVMQKVITN